MFSVGELKKVEKCTIVLSNIFIFCPDITPGVYL